MRLAAIPLRCVEVWEAVARSRLVARWQRGRSLATEESLAGWYAKEFRQQAVWHGLPAEVGIAEAVALTD